MILGIAKGIAWILTAGLTVLVGYLLLLTICAPFAPRHTSHRGTPDHRFLLLIPAHDEEKLLPELLRSLAAMDYPRALYEVHVVADNCTDRTAELARMQGAHVHERTDPDLRGKGYALNWLLEQLAPELLSPAENLAVVILDADSLVSPSFLTIMDAHLARGERAIQAYYAVSDPARSWTVSLRYAALAAIHYLRPQGRMVLGGSVGLKGNGMVLAADVVREHRWSAALVEDVTYHLDLVLAGERVTFAPDAVVLAAMPGTLAGSQSQNERWERGRVQAKRTYVPRLLREALRRHSYILFDAAMEQIIPPISMLAGVGVLLLLLALLLQAQGLALWAGGLLVALVVHVLMGLFLCRAPGRVYLALVYAPALIIWKVWLYLRVTMRHQQQDWVRTPRD